MIKVGIASALLLIFMFIDISPQQSFLKFVPKEYDLTLITQAATCDIPELLEGLCQGGNWAQVFSQSLYLTSCLSTFETKERLSAEELLQCASIDIQDRCAQSPKTLADVDGIIDQLKKGLTSNSCLPFKQTLTFKLSKQCPTKCASGADKQVSVKATNVLTLTNVQDIQLHIINNGPIALALKYKSSLNQYSSGQYKSQADDLDFGVRFLMIVGWSTIDGQTVWLAQNSFGSTFGVLGRVSINSNNPDILAYYGFQI